MRDIACGKRFKFSSDLPRSKQQRDLVLSWPIREQRSVLDVVHLHNDFVQPSTIAAQFSGVWSGKRPARGEVTDSGVDPHPRFQGKAPKPTLDHVDSVFVYEIQKIPDRHH